MSLLALIKKGGLRGHATATPATSATNKTALTPTVATIATVAVATAKNKGAKDPPAAEDRDCEAIKESSPNMAQGGGASCTQAVAKDAKATARDTDLCCWPHSSAMNTAEIDGFSQRTGRFAALGLTQADSEALADRLARRDRDLDDRRVCLECKHLYGRGRWRCSNSRQAGNVPVQLAMATAADLVRVLQRCHGFAPALSSAKICK
jgi:hypothetical protein